MSTLLLDPLGQSILRQLVEADEAQVTTRTHYLVNEMVFRSHVREHHQRFMEHHSLIDEFIEHLTLMGSPDVDISEYIEVARQEALIHEDDRDNGRVFDAAQDIVYAYLELWRSTH